MSDLLLLLPVSPPLQYGRSAFHDDVEVISRLALTHYRLTISERDWLQAVRDRETLALVQTVCGTGRGRSDHCSKALQLNISVIN